MGVTSMSLWVMQRREVAVMARSSSRAVHGGLFKQLRLGGNGMITEDCINRMLPVVADSWDRLRGCDVDRLLISIYYETLSGLYNAGKIVKSKRPDLSSQVDDAVSKIHKEMSQ